ncbi:N-acetylglucosaminyl-diphospho-decaprenol L-rhamnosyltransferase [Rhodoplanes serenus]|uniref:N-acetylglucosaminyl-diphospho-decaprenol L-rhamnosyltransferase n=2 Tax=Nitrobacteraceae TaxID=41294 RepID=A0A3S4BZ00_9BRAD|nr:N-acetylglucosaminyl-diphospho-decaprenol L-rhamnosyltransferase [Rhodoplanes serenus]
MRAGRLMGDLRRAVALARAHGAGELVRRIGGRLGRRLGWHGYGAWVRRFDRPPAPRAIEPGASAAVGGPCVSLLLPDATDPTRLAVTLDALRAQSWPHWELRAAVPGTALPDRRAALAAMLRDEPRASLVEGGFSDRSWAAAAAACLAATPGDLVAVIGEGDRLAPDALACTVQALTEHPNAVLAFTDEDLLAGGRLRPLRRVAPWFKPDWNPALMLGCDAVGRLAVIRRTAVEQAGSFRPGFDGAEEYDLVLRCAQFAPPGALRHVAWPLYHRRAGTRHPGGWRSADGAAAARRAVSAHLAATGVAAEVAPAPWGQRVVPPLPRPAPRVSILVPTTACPRVAAACFDTLLRRTRYDPFEVLVLVSAAHAAMPERAAFLDRLAADPRVRVLRGPDEPFNYAAVNNRGAEVAAGTVLCLLNDDTEAIGEDWLAALVGRVMQPGVGAAGAMLHYPDGTIQHAGVVLGLGGIAGHTGHREPGASPGPFGRFVLDRDVSAVTAACMAIRAQAFRAVGGFDAALPLAYNDVDLCLRLRGAGWRIVWTPAAALVHHESASLGRHDVAHAERWATDVRLMRERWGDALERDPFHNPNLSLARPDAPAFPPRTGRPRPAETPR